MSGLGPSGSVIRVSVVLMVLMCRSTAQDANCDFSSYVEAGKQYWVYSPNYPYAYNRGITCRWIAVCPTNYNCRLQCNVEMPQVQNCARDRLLVSESGDAALAGAHVYCGNGTFAHTSTQQRISAALLTSQATTGGRFWCQLSAVPATITNTTCSCGYKMTNRIVDGQETGVNEFPPMAGLLDTRISSVEAGGVIISEYHVLTAAHGLIDHTLNTLKIVVGEHNVRSGYDTSATQVLTVSRILLHPQFNSDTYNNDIGLVMTRNAIVFNIRVGPACLPFKYGTASFSGARVQALGWGTLFPGGPTSDTLQKVALDVISNVNCANRVGNSLTNTQMCTYTQGKDACQHDSGGPLLFTESLTNLLYAVGIISHGRFCASDYPGINTRVTSYLGWILQNTPNTNYCHK